MLILFTEKYSQKFDSLQYDVTVININEYIFVASLEKQPYRTVLKKIVLRDSNQVVLFNIAVLNLKPNSLKNIYDGLQFLVNLHVMLSCFWQLVQKSYIWSHHFAKQLFLWNTSWKLLLCFKSRGNFLGNHLE